MKKKVRLRERAFREARAELRNLTKLMEKVTNPLMRIKIQSKAREWIEKSTENFYIHRNLEKELQDLSYILQSMKKNNNDLTHLIAASKEILIKIDDILLK